MRYAARRDDNDADLRSLAEKLGVWTISTDYPCDYIAFYQGRYHLVEIKRPDKEGHADEFTRKQKVFHAEARIHGAPIQVWRTEADVLRFVEGT